jgi:hypothetical protein
MSTGGYRKQPRLTPALFIRLHVLHCTAKEVARALHISQQKVSEIETRESVPETKRSKYRRLAEQQGKHIPKGWFDQVPLPDVPDLNSSRRRFIITGSGLLAVATRR